MKFLIIEQDLRVSGTSQGIISRSFLSKLRTSYPDSLIDVVYLKQSPSEDQLELLPVDSIDCHILNLEIPFFTKWLNKLYWRLFHISLKERHIHKIYGSHISKIDHSKYDHIFIRSAGLNHETILGAKGLPILKKAIVNFHDPYPVFWYPGTTSQISNLELFRLKDMYEVISEAKRCMSTADLLSQDLEYLYGSKKRFYTLPHQYDKKVFDLSDTANVLKRGKKVSISYHGAIMFGRNIDYLLDAYTTLVENNLLYREQTEFVLRLRGSENSRLFKKYSANKNILVLDALNFSNSSYEQANEADILIILENGPIYSNTLVGKAPFVAALGKPVLCISPERSVLRHIIVDNKYVANCNDKDEIQNKLEYLIKDRLESDAKVYPFGDYFSDENFKVLMDKILDSYSITGKTV